MDTDKLKKIRDNVLDEIVPLLEEDTFDPAQRFTLLLATATSSGSADKFEAAHQAALKIDDNSEKANALLRLLDEVDVWLNGGAEEAAAEDQSNATDASSSETNDN